MTSDKRFFRILIGLLLVVCLAAVAVYVTKYRITLPPSISRVEQAALVERSENQDVPVKHVATEPKTERAAISDGVAELIAFIESKPEDRVLIFAQDGAIIQGLLKQLSAQRITVVLGDQHAVESLRKADSGDKKAIAIVQGSSTTFAFGDATLIVDLVEDQEAAVAVKVAERYAQLPDGVRIISTREGLENDTIRLIGTAGITTSPIHTLMLYKYEIKRPTSAEVIDGLLRTFDGFRIAQSEADFICEQGGNATYGEIPLSSAEKLFKELVPITDKDVFYDLGCGVGRLTLWVALGTPVKRSYGIELSKTRYELSCKAHHAVQSSIAQNKGKEILNKERCSLARFVQGNILDADLHDATVIFMCATCFSEDLMRKMADKLTKLKEGLRIVTMKEFPSHPSLKLVATHRLPMTWSLERGSPVYVYEVHRS